MPKYEISVPGQGTFQVESPTDLSDSQAYAAIQQHLKAPPVEAPKTEGRVGEVFSDIGKNLGALGVTMGTQLPETFFNREKKATESLTGAPYEALKYLSGQKNIVDSLRESYGFKTDKKEQPRNSIDVLEEQGAKPVQQAAAQAYLPGTREFAKLGSDYAQKINSTISPETRKQIEGSVPTWKITEGELPNLGKEPTMLGYGMQFLNVIASQVPIIAAATRGKNMSERINNAGNMGYRLSTGEGMGEARGYIDKMSDEELAKASPEFVSLSKEVGAKKARDLVTDKAMMDAGVAQGIVGRYGAEITGHLLNGSFDKFALNTIKNKAARIVAGTTATGAEQGLEEMVEGLAADIGVNKHVVKEIGADAFANLVFGALGGAPLGAYSAAKAKPESKKAPETAKDSQYMQNEKGVFVPVPPKAPEDTSAVPAATPATQVPVQGELDLQGGEAPTPKTPFQLAGGPGKYAVESDKRRGPEDIEKTTELRNQYDTLEQEIVRIQKEFEAETDPAKKQALLVQAQKLDFARQEVESQLKGSNISPRPTTPEGQSELFPAPIQPAQMQELSPAPTTGVQQDLFGEPLPYQVDPSALTIEQQKASEIERKIFALEQEPKTAKIKQEIEDLKAQLPKETTEGADNTKQGTLKDLKPPSPIVGNVMSKFGLAPKAPIRNAIKNLDMTDPEDRATFIDEINKHAIKKANINMAEVEKYLSYFEEKQDERPTESNTGAVEPSVSVPSEGSVASEGSTAPISEGVASDTGSTTGTGTTEETQSDVQPSTLEEPQTVSYSDIAPTMQEVVRSNPGANIERLAQMLGPQLYGSMEKITSVSVKEMFQNSYDAIKGMLQNGSISKGRLDIKMNKKTRLISVTDNGSGMTPEVLGNVFLTIAGTKKDTDISSGGFGIAKLLFLYGNKDIEVVTMRDGKISKMSTTGQQLRESLNDPSKAPNITITDATKDTKNADLFPEGHGTYVSVVIPEKYKDPQTGEEKDIPFEDSQYEYDVLQNSPLFADIDVELNDSRIWNMGSRFDVSEYTTFVDAKFDWGTARIILSNEEKDRWGDNFHILSNGLWQFSEALKKDPKNTWGPNIPYRFYVDLVPTVKPDQPGYPINLNRQGLTKEAAKDLNLIKNYIVLHYAQKEFSETASSFGSVQYLSSKKGGVTVSTKAALLPEAGKVDTKDTIANGSTVEIINGQLIVNGKKLPLLTPDDLKNASIDVESLRIPQKDIESNKVMVHDNLEVANSDGTFTPITELARDKFGGRFDEFMFSIGNTLMILRDGVSELVPATKGRGKIKDYKELAKQGVGISFDKEYRGVSIMIPFQGLFINPAFPEFIDTPEEAAVGMFGTMIHELAHFQERNHEAGFPAEMQRIIIKLETNSKFGLQKIKNDFIKSVQDNFDIIEFLNEVGKNEDNRPIGQRFKDGSNQATNEDVFGNVSEERGKGRSGQGLPSVSGQSNQNTGRIQQPATVPPTGTAAGNASRVTPVGQAQQSVPVPPTGTPPVPPTTSTAQVAGAGAEAQKNSEEFNKGFNPPPHKARFANIQRKLIAIRDGNLNVGSLFGNLQNFASNTQAYNNLMRKTILDIEKSGAMSKAQAALAHFRIMGTQATQRATLAMQMVQQGSWTYNPMTAWYETKLDPNVNMDVYDAQIPLLAKRLGVTNEVALQYVDEALEASRLDGFFKKQDDLKKEIVISEQAKATLEAIKGRNKKQDTQLKNEKANLKHLKQELDRYEKKAMHRTPANVAAGLKHLKYPEVKKALDVWQEMRERAIKEMVASGLLTEEKAQDWLDEAAYVPFFRDLDLSTEKITQQQIFSKGLRESTAPLRAKQVGSMEKLVSPSTNMRQWMAWSLASSISNRQVSNMIDQYKAFLPNEVQEGTDPAKSSFAVMENGVEKYYNVENADIAQAFMREATLVFPLMAQFKAISNFGRKTITRNPIFSLTQIPMDLYSALFTSGVDNLSELIGATISEAVKTPFNLSAIRKDMINSGMLNTHDWNSFNDDDSIKLASKITDPGFFKKSMHLLEKFGAYSDNVIRQGVATQLIKEGKTREQAYATAAELINFRNRSGIQTLNSLSQSTMFFNSWLQAVSVTMKTLSGKGLSYQTRAEGMKILTNNFAKVAAFSFLWAMAQGEKDDEEIYGKKSRKTRDRIFIIPGTEGMAIPIRMDMFAIPHFLAQDAYNVVMDKSHIDPKMVKDSVWDAFKGSVEPPSWGLAQALKVPAELALNKDIHTGQDIVPKYVETLEPYLQYNQSTGELAKTIGELTNTSPLKWEHALKGFTGSLITLFDLFADSFISQQKGIEKPAETWRETISKLPSAANVVGNDKNMSAVSDFYEVKKDVDRVITTYKKLATMDEKKAEEYLSSHGDTVIKVKALEQQFTNIKKYEAYIMGAKIGEKFDDGTQVTPKAKADKLKELTKYKNELGSIVDDVRKYVYKGF